MNETEILFKLRKEKGKTRSHIHTVLISENPHGVTVNNHNDQYLYHYYENL